MTVEIVVVLALAIAAVVLFASERFPVDLVALMLMATLLLTGIVTAEEGISGFSNTATVTVGAMFILSAGLFKTGVVNYLGSHVIQLYRFNFWIAMTATMIVAATLSAFINNTPVVAIFIPIMLGVASKINVSVSKLLMPLSFAAMFGGVCTLIGTSTNILVSTIAERYGQPPMTMFEFTPLGAIFLAAGILYMLLIGIRLIPDRRREKDLTKDFGMGDYITEIVLLPTAKSVGQRLRESALVREVDIEVLEVTRDGKKLRLPPSRIVLQSGDVLRVVGDVEKIKKLQDREGVKLKPLARLQDRDLMDDETTLVEAIVAPNSFLEGKTLKQVRFRDVYEATALALRHRGTVLHTKLGTTKLKAGDVLLVEAPKDRLQRLKEDEAFVFVSEVGLPQFRREKVLPALAIVGGVIAVAASGMLPIVVSAICGCVLLVLSRCLTLEEAYKAIDWKVIFLLAGALTLGVALEKTGTALFLSNLLITTVGSFGPLALVAAFYLLTSLLTETMSNNATAVLLAPIAIAAADSLQVDARPFLMAIAFAASASFMTPVGYQTNTMIYGVGQYKYVDFLKVGTPLNILFWIIATLLIPYFWPLN
jgi:di/tricarboxylate transporter